jgi:hypothetical protein
MDNRSDQFSKACSDGNLEEVKTLFKNGFYVGNCSAWRLAVEALENKYFEIVDLILDKFSVAKNEHIFILVCMLDLVDLFFYLLQKYPEIDINMKCNRRNIEAINYVTNMIIVKELLYRGANLYSIGGKGVTFFKYLPREEQDELLEYMDEIEFSNIKPAKK